jgi:hypothetical protein
MSLDYEISAWYIQPWKHCSNINPLTDCTIPNLGPLLVELAKDNSAEFYFVDGLVEQPAGEGIDVRLDGRD